MFLHSSILSARKIRKHSDETLIPMSRTIPKKRTRPLKNKTNPPTQTERERFRVRQWSDPNTLTHQKSQQEAGWEVFLNQTQDRFQEEEVFHHFVKFGWQVPSRFRGGLLCLCESQLPKGSFQRSFSALQQTMCALQIMEGSMSRRKNGRKEELDAAQLGG